MSSSPRGDMTNAYLRTLQFRTAMLTGALFAALILTVGRAAAQSPDIDVTGLVWDGRAGSPVAGALVRALDAAGTPLGPSTVSGGDGRFVITVPSDTAGIWLLAERAGFASSAPWEVRPAGEGPGALLLELQPLTPPEESLVERGLADPDGEGARVVGFVTDRQNGRPVATAQIEVLETPIRAITDPNGMFVLEGLPPGDIAVVVEHLSYAPAGRLMRLERGRSYEFRVGLSPEAIAVEGIEVTARSTNWFRDMQGLQFRMTRNIGGTFLLDSDFERRGYPPLSDMLRGLAGVRLRRTSLAGWELRFRGCELAPVVFVDGVQVNQPESGEPVEELTSLNGLDIQAVEIYRGAATVPGEFSGPDARCGALVIWTRRGG